MKKVLFSSLLLFLVALTAANASNRECFVDTSKRDAYCWDIQIIGSSPSGNNIISENVLNRTSTRYDHGGDSIYVIIREFGLGREEPTVHMNYTKGIKTGESYITDSRNIIRGTAYYYKINKRGYDLNSGMLEIRQYGYIVPKAKIYVK